MEERWQDCKIEYDADIKRAVIYDKDWNVIAELESTDLLLTFSISLDIQGIVMAIAKDIADGYTIKTK